jgi:hypothetical protein
MDLLFKIIAIEKHELHEKTLKLCSKFWLIFHIQWKIFLKKFILILMKSMIHLFKYLKKFLTFD